MKGQFKKSPCTWLVRFPTTLYKVKWGTWICHDQPCHIKTALPSNDPGSLNCNWFIATFLASWLHVTLHSVGPIGTIAWKKHPLIQEVFCLKSTNLTGQPFFTCMNLLNWVIDCGRNISTLLQQYLGNSVTSVKPLCQDIVWFTFVYSPGILHPSPAKSCFKLKEKTSSWWSDPPQPKGRAEEECLFDGCYHTGCWWGWSENRRDVRPSIKPGTKNKQTRRQKQTRNLESNLQTKLTWSVWPKVPFPAGTPWPLPCATSCMYV